MKNEVCTAHQIECATEVSNNYSFFGIAYFFAAFPPQQVHVSLTETNILAGDDIIMSCYATRQTTLLSMILLEVNWLDKGNNIITPSDGFRVVYQNGSMNHNITSRLTVYNIRTSQAGVYSCVVNITIPGVLEDHQVRESVNIYVTSKTMI